jgi:SNF2 family DNA or RNA helicase
MSVTLLDLKPGARVKGLQPNVVVTIQSLTTLAAGLHQISYILPTGLSKTHAIFETDFNNYDLASDEVPWSFKGDPNMFRLGVEAKRISLAHLYDPYLAVSTSMIEPLPHQITAVYEEMLPRQPLRFLLADDPGAGKTIMSGLLIKELQVRGDLKRCLIVTPGSLVEQWQTELREKFSLKFPILNSSAVDASPSGNVFDDHENLIVRVHMFSRSETLIDQMERAEPWDLIIVDEAHKMSAHLEGEEVKRTQLRELGEKLAERTRHFLLLTATPHNGKQADFEIFMSLIDSERFAIHRNTKRGATAPTPDAADLMRRMVKEKLVKFDGTPLFPERRAVRSGDRLCSRADESSGKTESFRRTPPRSSRWVCTSGAAASACVQS